MFLASCWVMVLVPLTGEPSKRLSFIISRRINSFDFMEEAEKAGKYLSGMEEVKSSKATSIDEINELEIDEELFDNPEMLLKHMK